MRSIRGEGGLYPPPLLPPRLFRAFREPWAGNAGRSGSKTDGTTLTATSINVGTLTIGGAAAASAAAIPEPGTFVLLAFAAIAALVIRKRINK